MNRFSQFFAGGVWRACSGAEIAPVFNPATEEQVGMVRLCSAQDVEIAVRAAAAIQPHWAVSNMVQRKDALTRLGKAIEVREQAFVASFALDAGCPAHAGRIVQAQQPRAAFAAVLQGLDHVRWRETVGRAQVTRAPLGVVAGLCGWSSPLLQMLTKAATAIAAGSSIVLKPSELTPATVRQFCEALEECDLPPGLVNVLYGGPAVGHVLASHPEVALIHFTGTTMVGQQLAMGAMQTFKRTVLQLGGKAAALLLRDADIEAAAPVLLQQALLVSGQSCQALTRVLVPQAQRDALVAALQAGLAEWKVGPPQDVTTRVGPLVSALHAARVNDAIAGALASGAELYAGGPGRPAGFEAGHYVAPTILGATPAMSIAREEVFGPVLCVIGYETDKDAVRIANDTPYGLTASVWSRDTVHAETVAARLRAGSVTINGASVEPGGPMGGFGASGHGRDGGRYGIEAMLELKSVSGAA